MKRIKYDGKTVIITGASSGIGRSVAFLLIRKYKCKVIAIARNEQRLLSAKEELSELGELYVPYPMDVSVKESWDALATYLKESATCVDILISCAGVLPQFKKFEDTNAGELESVLKINFLSQVWASKALMPLISDKGAIVNVSSASALLPFGGVSAYTSSKAASEHFSLALACESKRISVSCVMPGFVRTDIMKNQEMSEKDARFIRFFSAKCDTVSRKIVNRVKRRKRRIVIGKDAHLMSLLERLFPHLSPRLVTWFLKKSGLSLFKDI